MVNHSKTFRNQEARLHTNTLEGNWRILKPPYPIGAGQKDLLLYFFLDI